MCPDLMFTEHPQVFNVWAEHALDSTHEMLAQCVSIAYSAFISVANLFSGSVLQVMY